MLVIINKEIVTVWELYFGHGSLEFMVLVHHTLVLSSISKYLWVTVLEVFMEMLAKTKKPWSSKTLIITYFI